MTNEHIIPRGMVEAKETILATYNCERDNLIIKTLNESEREIEAFRNINLDVTIVKFYLKIE